MPTPLTAPGAYIEEWPSGDRTITGVPTSVTAFLGRTRKGPVNEATVVNSYDEFESVFGGLWEKSTLAFAVRDFFLNGGGQAVVVRLHRKDTTAGATPDVRAIKVGALAFVAASPGKWAEALRVTVDNDVSAAYAASIGLAPGDLFNLKVVEAAPGGVSEQFRDLTVKKSARRVDKVLEAGSGLLRWDASALNLDATTAGLPATPTAVTWDPLLTAEIDLQAKASAAQPIASDIETAQSAVAQQVAAVETSDGLELTFADSFSPTGAEANKQGLYALEQADLFNLLCIPPYLATGDVDTGLLSAAAAYCEKRRAMLLLDPPPGWDTKTKAVDGIRGWTGPTGRNAAIFFPRLEQPNPLHDNQLEPFVPCGAVAGIFARTDANRGVWKPPAGLEATLRNVPDLHVHLTDPEIGELNPLGVNCLRALPAAGCVVWGARTMQGNDQLASEWKYTPVRRTALYIEESLCRGTRWVVFEPNDEPLWAQIRLHVGAFMQTLFVQGAFQGLSPRDAYFVKCDHTTTTQDDMNRGVVNILVGFAPLKPAEFVVIRIQQLAGQNRA